ncbi:hypothetical protein [Sutcliffiella deserti]|uniref:hypothetical protein n=1 Tax=Sutcliffiella deserti TaxID=2875501 RepID=UPI001CC00649|nr:hypothetical protein [Sutcliffiella deserti]
MALLVYFINLFIGSNMLAMLLNGLSLMLLLSAMVAAGRFYFIMTAMFLICSVAFLVIWEKSWIEMTNGFSTMVKLILFIGIVPLISFPVQGYVPEIKKMLLALNDKTSSFKVSHYASFILANMINLAALPISKVIFFQDGANRARQMLYGELTIRSFALAMMVTPIGAAIAVAVDLTGTKWSSVLSVNFLIVWLGLFISYALTRKKRELMELREQEHEEGSLPVEKPNYALLVSGFLPFGAYFLFLIISDGSLELGIMELILLSVLPFTFVWSILQKKTVGWWNAVLFQIFQQNPKSFGQYAVIISAGLFLHTIELTGIDEKFSEVLPGIGLEKAAYFYIPVTIFVVLFLSMLGVHQFVAMIFMGELIDPEWFGIAPTVYASSLLIGFASGMLSSSFSGANILMSNLLSDASSYELGKKHYLFTFIFICISTAVLVVVNTYVF